MSTKQNKSTKTRLHIRNRNRERYDLKALIASNPELQNYIKPNRYGEDSVNFSDPLAVKELNRALLNYYYGISYWSFPDKRLCPPVPGRADYIHHIADLLRINNADEIPKGNKINGLDIGVGANCIYPIIGIVEYGWNFLGSDIDADSIESAQTIINANSNLVGKAIFRVQTASENIFKGIISDSDKIDFTICNPPFHATYIAAQKGSLRKIKNLSGKQEKTAALNFGGINSELICEGGEYQFIQNMIKESSHFQKTCLWFTTLVSKQSHLKGIYKSLESIRAKKVKTIPLSTGNKSSRIVAWTFMSKSEQKTWAKERWGGADR